MRTEKDIAGFFRRYFANSKHQSNKFWRFFTVDLRYQYLSDLLQWEETDTKTFNGAEEDKSDIK